MSPNAAGNTEILIQVAFAFVLAGAYGFAFNRLYQRLRRTGYQSPFTGLLIVAAWFLAVGLGMFSVWTWADLCWDCSAAANPEYFRHRTGKSR